jgi:hypothetical protein
MASTPATAVYCWSIPTDHQFFLATILALLGHDAKGMPRISSMEPMVRFHGGFAAPSVSFQ